MTCMVPAGKEHTEPFATASASQNHSAALALVMMLQLHV